MTGSIYLGPGCLPDGTGVPVLDLRGRGYHTQTHRRSTRLVVDDFGTAVAYARRCACCERWLPLNFDSFTARGDTVALGMQARCSVCVAISKRIKLRDPAKRERAYAQRRGSYARMSPEARARDTERNVASYRERRKRDPERVREQQREQQRRYRARVKADPKRHARYLEMQRMGLRLRREREDGIPLDQIRACPLRGPVVVEFRGGRFPALPLHDAVMRFVDEDNDRDSVCARAGITPRDLYAWGIGERDEVQFATADRALTGLNLLWWEVWTDDADPQAHAAAERAWCGNEVEVLAA